jgi:D-3-phosphoglycerate dehydrogenase
MKVSNNLPVLFLDTVHPYLKAGLETEGFTVVEDYVSSKESIASKLNEFQGLVIRSRFKLDKAFLEKGNQLRFIARVGAGIENIDVKAAESLGITCLHAPEGNRTAVAEQTLAMLLGLFNNLFRANQEVRKGLWFREQNRGIELEGKTVAIIGYGNMGSALAQRLIGFGCKVLLHDKYKTNFAPSGFEEANLQRVYDQADIVSLHLPLTTETTYFADSNFFNSFIKPIWIVNTARGKCLKTTDLVKAMQAGKVVGACLDVLEYESLSFENFGENLQGEEKEAWEFLIASDQVVLSPHIGGWTHESNLKMAEVLVEKVRRLRGF